MEKAYAMRKQNLILVIIMAEEEKEPEKPETGKVVIHAKWLGGRRKKTR